MHSKHSKNKNYIKMIKQKENMHSNTQKIKLIKNDKISKKECIQNTQKIKII